jgi:hypothetical protein
VLSITIFNALDLTYQMLNDSRYAAAEWLAARTRPGDVVEYFGPSSKLPHLEAGVITHQAADFHGMYVIPELDDAKVQEILTGWRTRQPKFIIIMPDHTSRQRPIPYSHTVPPQLYDALINGDLEYKLVAFFQTPSLFPWLRQPLLDYPVVNPPIRIFAAEQTISRLQDIN